jgi:hypothetical protein
MRIRQTILVGAGGTGGWLCEPLSRLLRFHPEALRFLTIVDGDSFEEHNHERQAGALNGMNKAEVAKDRLPRHAAYAHPHYIEGEDLRQIISDADYDIVSNRSRNDVDGVVLVVMAVDNDKTRASILDWIYDVYGGDVLILNPGNGYTSVTCSASFRLGGVVIGQDLRDTFPQYKDPQDRSPTEGSCAEEVESSPQLLAANLGSAWATLCAVQAWLDDEPLPMLFQTDVRSAESAFVSHRRALPGWTATLAAKAAC